MNDSRLTDVVIGNLEWLGGQYFEEYLRCFDINRLRQNWWSGLYFFLSRSFMRGRSDDLSMRYFNHALCVLSQVFAIDESDLDGSFSRLCSRADEFSRDHADNFVRQAPRTCTCPVALDADLLRNLCPHLKSHNELFARTRAGCLPLNHEGDIKMVAAVLREVVKSGNIFRRVEQVICHTGISQAYELLTGWDSTVAGKRKHWIKRFPYVADKIAGLVIRDIYLLNLRHNVDDSVLRRATSRAEVRKLFPVDTWVRKIARKIGWDGRDADDEGVKDFFLDKCDNHHPAMVAAGIWYMGFNALDLFIDHVLIKGRLGADG